jgi:tubulin polyglutamylase TTLL5
MGYKFDLRLYVTVTSFNPLEAFIYREGFARFGSRRFTSQSDCISDTQIHLTNSSIQREYDSEINAFHPVRLAGAAGGGNKVKISWLWNRLDKEGIETTSLWKRIKDLCLKTLVAVNDDIQFQPNSFEMFGFDVIFDEQLKPWLIEVNSCPSLARDTALDVTVKESVVRDTIELVNPIKYDRYQLARVCKRRQINKKQRVGRGQELSEKEQLEEDLTLILRGKRPRQYGEDISPEVKDCYERLAPGTKLCDQLKRK